MSAVTVETLYRRLKVGRPLTAPSDQSVNTDVCDIYGEIRDAEEALMVLHREVCNRMRAQCCGHVFDGIEGPFNFCEGPKGHPLPHAYPWRT